MTSARYTLVCALLMGGCTFGEYSYLPSEHDAAWPAPMAVLSADDLADSETDAADEGEDAEGGSEGEGEAPAAEATDGAQGEGSGETGAETLGEVPDTEPGFAVMSDPEGDGADQAAPEGEDIEPGFENEFPPGIGVRFGATGYLEANTDDVTPRVLVGAYVHFAESERTRFEAGFDLTPDVENAADSYYFIVDAHFTGFLNSAGSLYYRVGGGGIFETRGATTATVGMLDVGGGVWLRVSEDTGVFTGLTFQFPIGADINVPAVLLVTGGVDF